MANVDSIRSAPNFVGGMAVVCVAVISKQVTIDTLFSYLINLMFPGSGPSCVCIDSRILIHFGTVTLL